MSKDKLEDLQQKIDAAQAAKDAQNNSPPSENSVESMNKGMQILTELIGIMIASGVIGYFIDQWFQTSPASLLILLILGMITFFYKLIKTTKNL